MNELLRKLAEKVRLVTNDVAQICNVHESAQKGQEQRKLVTAALLKLNEIEHQINTIMHPPKDKK